MRQSASTTATCSAANANPVVESHVDILNNRTVTGWEKCKSFTVYFHAEFDTPFTSYGTWKEAVLHPGSASETGKPIGAHLDFNTTRRGVVLAKVDISLVDGATAKQNLAREIPGWGFDKVRQQAAAGPHDRAENQPTR